MRGINKVILIGNLGQDAELRYTASGESVCTLSIAVNYIRRDGEPGVEWVSVVMFGDTAEKLREYLRKGKQVYVEGRLQTKSWVTESGEKRYRTDVIANSILLLGNKGGSGGIPEEEDDEDLPF